MPMTLFRSKMKSNMNTTKSSRSKGALSVPTVSHIPYLGRLRLLRIELEHKPVAGKAKLTGKVHRDIAIAIIPSTEPGVSNNLIEVIVTVNGKWTNGEEEVPVVKFFGEYRARLRFAKVVTDEQITTWMQDSLYREVAIAQVIPLVNQHLYSQLEMLGISSGSRSLGLDPDSIQETLPASMKQARSPRKNKSQAQE